MSFVLVCKALDTSDFLRIIDYISPHMEQKSLGYLYAATAYSFWGFLPLYWKALNHIPPVAILSYRIAFAFITAWLVWVFIHFRTQHKKSLLQKIPLEINHPTIPGEPEEVLSPAPHPGKLFAFHNLRKNSLFNPKLIGLSFAAALLITLNWFVYIFAVVRGFTLEASLGYFLTPLVNVILGMILLQERPKKLQITALTLGLIAVLILTVSYGKPPFIALTLSVSFGLYGYVKKLFPWGSIPGIGLETLWVLPLALGILFFQGSWNYLITGNLLSQILLVVAGPVTLTPLVFFASAARRLPLSILGFFQYLSPSFMFLIGWLVFHEPVGVEQLAAFTLIWIALGIFSFSILQNLSKKPVKLGVP